MTTTPEPNFVLSSRKRRIAAFIIDHFVLTFLMMSVIFLMLGPTFMDQNSAGRMTTTMLIVMVPGFLLYFAKDSIGGVSIGKWIMGIMVRDASNLNDVPSFARLFARNLFVIIWPVEFIALASDPGKKRLGDKALKTTVVKNPLKLKRLPRILTLIVVGITFFVFIFIFAGTAMKSSDAYKVAIQEIEQNQNILKETGGIKGYGMMPSGNVSISNGTGQADLQIKVIGNKKDLTIQVHLTKEPNGKWTLIELNK